MGSGQSSEAEAERHDQLFLRAVTAAKEGRYCVSELYFQQTLEQHPGRLFWASMVHCMSSPVGSSVGSPVGSPAAAEADQSMPKIVDPVLQHLTLNEKGRVELPLHFDDDAEQVVDYMRLCADIANTYLRLKPDSINRGIALSYYASLHTITQYMFPLMVMWLMENREGFLSGNAEQVADVAIAGFDMGRVHKMKESDALIAGQEATKKKKVFGDRPSTNAEIFVEYLKLLETVRYYYSVSGINFTLMAIQRANAMDRKKEVGKIRRVMVNAMDIIGKFHYDIGLSVDMQRETDVTRIVKQFLPAIEYVAFPEIEGNHDGEESDNEGKGAGTAKESSHGAANGTTTAASVTATKLGGQAFLYQAKYANPAAKITVDFLTDPPMRLSVKSGVLRHQLCELRCAAQRDTLVYFNWFFADEMSFYPGHTHSHLAKELSYYRAYLEKSSGSPLMEHRKASDGFTVMPNPRGTDEELLKAAASANTASPTPQKLQVQTDKVKKVKKGPMVNPGLNLRDATTIQLVDYEEALFFQTLAVLVLAKLCEYCDRLDRTEAFRVFADKVTETLYGPGSLVAAFFEKAKDITAYAV